MLTTKITNRNGLSYSIDTVLLRMLVGDAKVNKVSDVTIVRKQIHQFRVELDSGKVKIQVVDNTNAVIFQSEHAETVFDEWGSL